VRRAINYYAGPRANKPHLLCWACLFGWLRYNIGGRYLSGAAICYLLSLSIKTKSSVLCSPCE